MTGKGNAPRRSAQEASPKRTLASLSAPLRTMEDIRARRREVLETGRALRDWSKRAHQFAAGEPIVLTAAAASDLRITFDRAAAVIALQEAG